MKSKIAALIRDCIEAQLNEESVEDMVVNAICEINFAPKIQEAIGNVLEYKLDDYIDSAVAEAVEEFVEESLDSMFD